MTGGLAIKLQANGFYSAQKIMEKHINKLRECGKVYFSTDVVVDKNLGDQVKVILFYNKKEWIFYLATVDKILVNKSIGVRQSKKNKFIPGDFDLYSVDEYKDQEKSTWILLTEIRRIDIEELNGWTTFRGGFSVIDQINTPGRFSRFYFIIG